MPDFTHARARILARAEAGQEPDDLSTTSLSPTQRRIVQAALDRAAERAAWDQARTEQAAQDTQQASVLAPIKVPGGGLNPSGPTTAPSSYDFRTWLAWLAERERSS